MPRFSLREGRVARRFGAVPNLVVLAAESGTTSCGDATCPRTCQGPGHVHARAMEGARAVVYPRQSGSNLPQRTRRARRGGPRCVAHAVRRVPGGARRSAASIALPPGPRIKTRAGSKPQKARGAGLCGRWARRVSNLRPLACEARGLTTVSRHHTAVSRVRNASVKPGGTLRYPAMCPDYGQQKGVAAHSAPSTATHLPRARTPARSMIRWIVRPSSLVEWISAVAMVRSMHSCPGRRWARRENPLRQVDERV